MVHLQVEYWWFASLTSGEDDSHCFARSAELITSIREVVLAFGKTVLLNGSWIGVGCDAQHSSKQDWGLHLRCDSKRDAWESLRFPLWSLGF